MSKVTNLKPTEELKISQRNLPHWELPGSTYFITFKTIDKYYLNDTAKEIVLDSIKFHNNKKYVLLACVVMSTHIHLILTPREIIKGSFFSLAQIMHSVKSYSANKIQKTLEKKGKIWLDEYYDRLIRNEDELFEEMSYIINNPVKDGLVKEPKSYKWLCYKDNT